MVLPPGISAFARSWSTWIHCSSQVASANLLMRSCVTSIQSLTPISVPTAALSSSNPLNIRMASIRVRVQSFISGTLSGTASSASVTARTSATRDAGRRLQQRRLAAGKGDDRHFGHDEIDRPRRGQRQVALGDDLGFALRGVLHGDDHALGAADEVHGAAHARHHLAGDHPVGEMTAGIDLQAAKHGDVDMAAADQAERHRAVEGGRARQRTDRLAAGIGQQRMRHALFGDGTGADQPVLGLEEDVQPFGHVVRDQRRNADAEIDEIAGSKLLRHAPGDDGLCIHGSPVRDEVIDQGAGRHDMVGRDDADRNDVFGGDDDGVGRHRHHRIEIARRQGVGEVAGIIGQECVHQREIGAQRGLQQDTPCR